MPSERTDKSATIAGCPKPRPNLQKSSSTASTRLDKSDTSASGRWNARGPLLLIVVVTLFTFSRLFTAEFTTWDDDVLIYKNPLFNPPTLHSVGVWWSEADDRMWNPLTEMMRGALALCTTSTVDPVTETHLNPYIFHANNVILHVLTTLLVYQVLRLLRFGNWPACAGALLFGVHPVQVEPVAWVSALKDILCGFLSVSAIWALLRANGFRTGQDPRLHDEEPFRTSKFYFTLATVLFVLATLSKPTAVTLALIALPLTCVRWNYPPKKIWMQMGLWILLALPMMILTKRLQSGQTLVYVDYWKRPLVAGDALAFYLCKLFWPATLTIDYGRRPLVIFQRGWAYWTWLLPGALFAALAIFRRQARVLTIGAIAFVAPVLPLLGLLIFDFQQYSTVADRYLYLSMIGAAICFAWMVQQMRWKGLIIAGLVLAPLAAKSWVQSGYWHDSWSLFSHADAVNPTSPTALDNLAVVYDSIGDVDSTLKYLHRGIAARPDMTDFYTGLGLAELKAGDWNAALEAYRTGYAIEPDKMSSEAIRQSLKHGSLNHCGLAIQFARIAVALRPDAATAHLTLGTVLAQCGNRDAALPELRKAAGLDSANFAIQFNLATVLGQAGNLDEARSHYQRALLLQPNDAEAIKGLQRIRESQKDSSRQ